MALIVVPDDSPPVLKGTGEEERLKRLGDVRIFDSRALTVEELTRRIADAEIVMNIRATSVFSEAVLRNSPKLKMISIYGIGYDNVDLKTASELGITVTNTPGYSGIAVAEMALALMLAVSRRLVQNDRLIRKNQWAREYAGQLYGKTLGVIGTGNIGERMIKLGKALGMRVIAWTYHPSLVRAKAYGIDFVELEELLRQSDVVSIHILGSKEATRLIGKKEIGLMKPSAIIVNTARGSVIDEDALVEALTNRRIAGAGLDVFAVEPLPTDHPFKSLDNVILSPHIAANVPEATLSGLAMAADNIASFLKGKPVNVVRPRK